MVKKKYDKVIAYWIFQIVFWSIYFFSQIQYFFPKAQTSIDYILYLIFLCYFGIILTSIQRIVYKKFQARWSSNFILFIAVTVSSAVLAIFWVLEIILLDKFLILLGYPVTPPIFYYYFRDFFFGFILLIFWSALYLSYKFWQEWKSKHEIELQLKEIQNQKLEAELQTLKSQLNPHFLFNVLNSIYSHSLFKSDKTPDIVLKLSDLMSYILYDCKTESVSLKKEIEFIQNYIELEKIRLEDDIDVEFSVTEINNEKIPPLLFIPLIENAFKHGSGIKKSRRTISIWMKIEEQNLFFKIENSKIENSPYKGKRAGGSGIGIENVKKRLQLIYPNRHEFNIIDGELSFDINILLKDFTNVDYENKMHNS